MKFGKVLSMLALMFATVCAYGETKEFTLDNISYSFEEGEDECMAVKGENPYVVDLVIPDEVEFEGKLYKVTETARDAFRDLSYVKSIVVGKNMRTLAPWTFGDSMNGETYTTIDLPESLKVIEYWALQGGFYEITIPESVEYIGICALACKWLKFNAVNCKIDDSLHQSPLYCSTVHRVTFGDKVTGTPDYICAECPTLKVVDFGPEVRTIGYESFRNCQSLTECVLPETVETIGHGAFYNCLSLVSMAIPSGVTRIEAEAFRGCTSLKEIYYNAADCKTGDLWGSPFPVTLERVEIGDAVRRIPDYAFGLCTSLKPVVIPEGVESVGKQSFRNCIAMDSIVLPASMTSLGEKAFEGCSHIKAVYSLSVTPPAAYDNSFGCYDKATLYVPYGAGEAYRNAAACWGKFSQIVETDFAMLDKVYNAIDMVGDGAHDGLNVTVTDRHVSVETTDGATVAIYTANGTEIYHGIGCKALALMPGLYIVTCNGQTAKIAVR